MSKLLSKEEVQNKINKVYGKNNYLLISDYKGTSKEIIVKHKCGYQYTIKKANKFLNENSCLCPKCNTIKKHSTRRKSEKEIKELIEKETNNEYSYISGYIDSKTKIKIKHNKCNNIFECTPHMFLGKYKTRCPICANKNRGKYLLKENYLNSILDKDYEWLEDYKGNNKSKHLIKHLLCGNTYEVRPNDFQQGYRCPFCSNKESDKEKELLEFIKSIYNGNILTNCKDIIKPYELDIYIPDKNIAFEFNGLYWHSDKFKDNNYHLNKTEECKKLGIQLIHIFEDEWDNKKDIIKTKIIYILGLSKAKRIYGRSKLLSIKEINNTIKNDFLDKNHIQGRDYNTELNLGLFYNDLLVSVMTFCKLRINLGNKESKEGYYELSRFATDINYNIVGGFGKLFSYFKNTYDFNSIITYADRRWSEGNLYYKNGFILDHISKPNYFYITKGFNKRYNRFNFAKYKLKTKFKEYYRDDLTEKEIMKLAGYNRIYDCGTLVFKYKV